MGYYSIIVWVQKFGLRRPQTSFRQSFLFSSSANEALLAGCWEATILDKRPGESDAIFMIPVISGCRKSPSTLLVGWGKGLATFDLKKPHEQAVYNKRFAWYKIAIQENKRCTKTTNTKENCHFTYQEKRPEFENNRYCFVLLFFIVSCLLRTKTINVKQ